MTSLSVSKSFGLRTFKPCNQISRLSWLTVFVGTLQPNSDLRNCVSALSRLALARGTRPGELDSKACGVLRKPGGVLRGAAGNLRGAAGACGKAAGACGKAAGACGKAAGACGKAAGACGSLQQGAATPREILFQARIQARGLSEFRYKRL
ncbi:hypothetical protein QL285_045711 [Trifolium repens]|nr:hypothetical protein QL285_045711 [Trifolium repens]